VGMGLTESGPVVRDWDGDTWGDDVMYRVRGREIKSLITGARLLALLSTCSAKSVCSRTV
jgi:hypothetical protein